MEKRAGVSCAHSSIYGRTFALASSANSLSESSRMSLFASITLRDVYALELHAASSSFTVAVSESIKCAAYSIPGAFVRAFRTLL